MSNLDLIETDRLVLSGWTREQLPDLVALHSNPAISLYLSASGAPWTTEQCARRLDLWIELFSEHQLGKLRIRRKSDNQFVGRAGFGLHPPTGEPEIGYAMLEPFQGQGFAREAAAALRDWLFASTDWNHFIGFADVRNAPSRAVLRRIGMQETEVADYEGMTCQFHVLERSQ